MWLFIFCFCFFSSTLYCSYAEVVVATTESFQTLLEKVPGCKVNGEKVECRFATHQNLKLFENVAKKRKNIVIMYNICWCISHVNVYNVCCLKNNLPDRCSPSCFKKLRFFGNGCIVITGAQHFAQTSIFSYVHTPTLTFPESATSSLPIHASKHVSATPLHFPSFTPDSHPSTS